MVGAGNLDFVNSFSQDRFSGKDKSYDKAQKYLGEQEIQLKLEIVQCFFCVYSVWKLLT